MSCDVDEATKRLENELESCIADNEIGISVFINLFLLIFAK